VTAVGAQVTYLVREVFYSIQGEGTRTGIPHVFVRFARCNLRCNVEEHGFDCDTDFAAALSTHFGAWDLLAHVRALAEPPGWTLFTGGEPALQLDQALVDTFHGAGYSLAIETNGTVPLPRHLDWVCVSPKPGAPVVVTVADEVKHVLRAGQEPPPTDAFPKLRGRDGGPPAQLVSPAFTGADPDPEAMQWCVDWVLAHPACRLSIQAHKFLRIR